MKSSAWIVALAVGVVAFVVLVVGLGVFGRRRAKYPDSPAGSAQPAASNLLDPGSLGITTAKDANSRVDRVFPNGVATEDARAEVGSAPPPPSDEAPDGHTSWVAELTLTKPETAERVRAALPPGNPKRIERWVKGHVVGSERWLHVRSAKADARFDRVAVIADLVDSDRAITAADVDRHLAWTRSFATQLGTAAPSVSMTAAEAVKKAQAAVLLRKQFTDKELDVGIAISVPQGKLFPGRLVWDAVYSAGFTWGAGDYFHWVPSPHTDVSQGISMNTTTGTGYFLPESLLANDGTGDVGSLDMSFNVATTWHPLEVFDVMVRAATYVARRLGGKLASSPAGPDFDARAGRERVAKIEKAMTASGVVPGSSLALIVF